MANATYLVNEKNQLIEDRIIALDSAVIAFRQVMAREFPDDLVSSHDMKDYALDIYDVHGSAVVITEEDVRIISSNSDSLAATKNNLEERLRYFTLTEKD